MSFESLHPSKLVQNLRRCTGVIKLCVAKIKGGWLKYILSKIRAFPCRGAKVGLERKALKVKLLLYTGVTPEVMFLLQAFANT